MKKRLPFVLLLFISFMPFGESQIGGLTNFEFLNLNASARITGLGGGVISVVDQDVSMAFQNPAVLSSEMHNALAFNHSFYFAGISHGNFNYGFHKENWKTTFHGGINYINYGDFISADETGIETGSFGARQQVLVIGASRAVGPRIKIGFNMKFVNSAFESYSSVALATDIGATYTDPEKNLSLGFVINNIGTTLSNFTEDTQELPVNIQLGLSKKLAHLPFRISVTAHHLNKWNLRYDNPLEETTSLFGEAPSEPNKFNQGVENFFRHFIFSGEFLFGKNQGFQLRFAYNHQRKKELAVSQFTSFGGFSFGLGMRIKKIRFDYGVGLHHLGQTVHHLGLGINIDAFRKKI